MTHIFSHSRAFNKTFGKSHVMGSERVDASGSLKTRTALVISVRYILIGVSEFFVLFMTEKSGQMIKCLLTELGQAGREIFGSWSFVWTSLCLVCMA